MIRIGQRPFRRVTLVDFEFTAPPGERPRPICCVARNYETGATLRLWEDELRERAEPPYPIGRDSLVVAYYASAEIGCHLALGWRPPAFILDLYTEFRNLTNGTRPLAGDSLLGALTYFQLDAIGAAEKDSMRQLAIRGGPWTAAEREALLTYCAGDVIALDQLLRCMPLDGDRSLLRGRYMAAVAAMEHVGVPIDVPLLMSLSLIHI